MIPWFDGAILSQEWKEALWAISVSTRADHASISSRCRESGAYARIDFGPICTAASRNGLKATGERLSDKCVARLIKSCALAAGLRPDLPEAERIRLFSGHSLRAGLASSAEVDEPHVQKQLGHASAEMTRRCQRRRERLRVNRTKAAGL